MNPTWWWQAIDQQLLHHLMSRTTQPGVSRPQLAQTILERMQNMTRPLPLLADLTQRHAAAITGGADIPIVYAQPVRLNDQLHGGKSSGLSSAVATQHSLLVHQQHDARGIPPSQFRMREQVVHQAESQGHAAQHTMIDKTSSMPVVRVATSPTPTVGSPQHTSHASPVEPTRLHVSATQDSRSRAVEDRQPLENAPPRTALSSVPEAPRPMTVQLMASQPFVIQPLVQIQDRSPTVLVLAAPGAAVSANPSSRNYHEGKNMSQPETWTHSGINAPTSELRQRHPEQIRTNSPIRVTDSPTVSPTSAQGRRERGIDISKLADSVQRQLNLEQLAAKVQGQLRRRLTIERERRGGR